LSLKIYDKVPETFLEIDILDLHKKFPGPFLMHLKGEKSEPLFLSVLLHGNETTGLLALKKVLSRYSDKPLPRDMIILVGNTKAAAYGLRHLEGQPDYNRIWAGGESEEARLISEVLDYVKKFKLFANIDVHNNTGKNPYYGCVNVFKEEYLDLAKRFSEKTVYFTEPSEVESMAFAPLCPSVTIEAGLPGKEDGVAKTAQYIEEVLSLEGLNHEFDIRNTEVFQTVARIKIHKDASIDFANEMESQSDFSLLKELDLKNFERIQEGTLLGFYKVRDYIKVVDNEGVDVTTNFLELKEGKIFTKKDFVPAMFTQDVYVIKEDCLGYVMENFSLT